jgi:iron complex transport system substrate-binding protein
MTRRNPSTTAVYPQRIVSLQPSATATLSAIGALERLVACTRHCPLVCPGVDENRIVLEDSWSAQAPQILATNPDLVIASVPYQTDAVAEILKSGARFLALAPRTLMEIYKDILTISGAVGLATAGEATVAAMQDDVRRVIEKTAGLAKPRVYCEQWGKPILRSESWIAELIEIAGGTFLGKPREQVTAEQVAGEDPEVIVFAWCGAGDRVPSTKIIRERCWENLKAVQSKRVYVIADELLNTPGPTLIKGLAALTAVIHPDLFAPSGMRTAHVIK